ncbi:hypothetical protein [Gemmatimonas aurantiaca]|uniref:hypothetical protein n=1 Tax=Gemmatimonas aurantiaca TaxID=173480 RepID=UPI00059BC767|nr:hypothetical protein [Gemmatimonas aurantiaca]
MANVVHPVRPEFAKRYAVSHRAPPEPNSETLPAEVAARLFARASELDVAYGDNIAVPDRRAMTDLRVVADLRAAAIEAGISARAFDAALAELAGTAPERVPEVGGKPRPRRVWALAAGVMAFIAVGVVAVQQSRPWKHSVPTVDEAFVLRCMTADEAAGLVLPVLGDPTNSQLKASAQTPRVLTVRTTPAQMRNVRAVLAEHEPTGSQAVCAPRSASNVTP